MRPLIITLSVVLLLGAGYFAAVQLAEWGATLGADGEAPTASIEAGQPVTVEIPAGSPAVRIGEILAEAGVVESADAFAIAVRAGDWASSLQAGSYEFLTGMSVEEVIGALVSGPVSETFWITIPEGLRIEEILGRLADGSAATLIELEEALLSGSVATSIRGDLVDLAAWEGLLFPDTYEFRLDASPGVMLQRMADTMVSRLGEVDPDASYETVVVASLIEAEARLDVDRPLIASVIANRRELGMPLQIDATVLYAMGERGVSLSTDDLQFDSPYNTYLVTDLPPTPIGAPGLASLAAAVAPAESDYLYYVLTSGEGQHSFTSSYDEFLAFKAQAKEDGIIP